MQHCTYLLNNAVKEVPQVVDVLSDLESTAEIQNISSLYVCMAIKYIIVLFVETKDPGLRIESFAVINLRGVSTNKTIIIQNMLNVFIMNKDHY
jgi:hypothetical protein